MEWGNKNKIFIKFLKPLSCCPNDLKINYVTYISGHTKIKWTEFSGFTLAFKKRKEMRRMGQNWPPNLHLVWKFCEPENKETKVQLKTLY